MANTRVPNLFNFQTIGISILVLSFISVSNAATVKPQPTTSTTPTPMSPNFEGVRCLIYMGKQLDQNPTHTFTSLNELETAFKKMIPIKNCAQIIQSMRLEAFSVDQREPVQELINYVNQHIQFGQKVKA